VTGDRKLMRTGSAQGHHRFMIMQEVREIWRTTGVQGFEGQGGKFKPYAPFDSEPMELFEKI